MKFMKKELLINTIIGIVLVSILGTLFHFVYEWTGENHFVGMFVPVNESTWEHMKLMFFPMLIFFLLDSKLPPQLSFAKYSPSIATTLLGTFLIPVLFYTYTGILGTHYSVLDIATFYISVIAAFVFRYRYIIRKMGATKFRDIDEEPGILLSILLVLVFGAFLFFTHNPPEMGIFMPPV